MSKLNRQIIVSIAAIGCVYGAYTLSQAPEGGGPGMPPPPTKQSLLKITTFTPTLGEYQASVTAFGEAKPEKSLKLTAEVSGRVVKLATDFDSGNRFKKNSVLLKIDDTEYKQAVASAKAELTAAEVELLQQQLNRQQAQAEWQRSGLSGQPDSELALYRPQVKAAEAKVEYARQTLAKARADLKKTEIRAPFNALIVSRAIEVGSNLQSGTEIATLYGTDQLEVALSLSSQEWDNLPPARTLSSDWQVSLKAVDQAQQWSGTVDRIARHVDSSSRQRALIVRIEDPLGQATPLYSGTFIRAEVPGKRLSGLWQLPASAITRDGTFWYVDESDTLQSQAADIRFRRDDQVYITPPTGLVSVEIATRPLNSYLPGMKVELTAQPAQPLNDLSMATGNAAKVQL